MTRLGIASLPLLIALAFSGAFRLRAESPQPEPDFQEVYSLIRQHLVGANDTDLNNTAVRALVSALSPKVALVGDSTSDPAGEKITKSRVFDGGIGYIRVNRVGEELDKGLRQTCDQLATSNKLNGLIIDLRYAGGADYAAAVAVADLFVKKQEPLLDWGQGVVRSKEKANAIDLPLAVLVNEKTAAAAEALAAVLRETGVGLVLGRPTAGQALIAQEYPLKNGQRLRIATGPVQLGDGGNLSGGIKPDISVETPSDDERLYYANAFKQPMPAGASGTGATNTVAGGNRPRRPRFNEAELVRERRDGLALDSDFASGSDPDKPVVRDPVLARALDFLKGLSVMRQTRS